MASQDHRAAASTDDSTVGFMNDMNLAMEQVVKDSKETKIPSMNNGLVYYGSSDEESKTDDEVEAVKETTATKVTVISQMKGKDGKVVEGIRENVVVEEVEEIVEDEKEEDELIVGSEKAITHVVTPPPTLPSPPISPIATRCTALRPGKLPAPTHLPLIPSKPSSEERKNVILENNDLSRNQKCAALNAFIVARERERKERAAASTLCAESLSGSAEISGGVGGREKRVKSVEEELNEINKTAKNDEERRERIRELASKNASPVQNRGRKTSKSMSSAPNSIPESWVVYITPSQALIISERKIENAARHQEIKRLPEARFTEDERARMAKLLKKNIENAKRRRMEADAPSGFQSEMGEAEVKKETDVHLMRKVPLPGEDTRLFNRQEPSAEAESEHILPPRITQQEIIIDSSDDEKPATATQERPDDTKKRVRVVPANKKPQPESTVPLPNKKRRNQNTTTLPNREGSPSFSEGDTLRIGNAIRDNTPWVHVGRHTGFNGEKLKKWWWDKACPTLANAAKRG
ncbi:hypothetical protein SAICODRAFT_28271 [Saitoella complicata NRRL Y-17804]|uniref:Uncharacterized protein n=1 Tax=Saitoella complicata (strain BCRC 22490 / CBS 7301 / JCM 7358 / NBRC 10748 / NRRL Y-17804) TaxID=698492 RepID=A0A0E9NE28_SAICN|nr:uncharacterized protein SAICODRAFT_28271 [Saitoella complicata NRRL Y-17804]ODQ49664.1 hypothetical protein SAICODRAFT_28271 [Saitoella complicata NRRL Y-17804]GAO48107.1 hypothetical protein G7K_2294-t2 [Saitoella complicata NRRL Y-17804]